MSDLLRTLSGRSSDADLNDVETDVEFEDEAEEQGGLFNWSALAFWRRHRHGAAVPFPGARRHGIYAVTPMSLREAQVAADYIKNGVAVFVNLQHIDRKHAQRIVDVLSGVCYAIDGTSMRVGDRLFLFVPPSIAASGDERSLQEMNQLFMGGIATESPSATATPALDGMRRLSAPPASGKEQPTLTNSDVSPMQQ